MREDKLYNDTASLFQPAEEEEDIDLDFDSNNLKEFEGKSTMTPSTRNLLSTANKPVIFWSTSTIDINSLVNYFDKVSLKAPHIIEQMCSNIQNNLTKNKKDFEGEFITFPINVENFRSTLSPDILNCLLRAAKIK